MSRLTELEFRRLPAVCQEVIAIDRELDELRRLTAIVIPYLAARRMSELLRRRRRIAAELSTGAWSTKPKDDKTPPNAPAAIAA